MWFQSLFHDDDRKPVCQQESATSRGSRWQTITLAFGNSQAIKPSWMTLSGILSTMRVAVAGASESSLAR